MLIDALLELYQILLFPLGVPVVSEELDQLWVFLIHSK
jgi:hypothetical protein